MEALYHLPRTVVSIITQDQYPYVKVFEASNAPADFLNLLPRYIDFGQYGISPTYATDIAQRQLDDVVEAIPNAKFANFKPGTRPFNTPKRA